MHAHALTIQGPGEDNQLPDSAHLKTTILGTLGCIWELIHRECYTYLASMQ